VVEADMAEETEVVDTAEAATAEAATPDRQGINRIARLPVFRCSTPGGSGG
jgi:hypothetical protein